MSERPGQAPPAARPAPPLEPDALTIGDWLQIEADGAVIVYTGKTEVGQNIRTSLTQAVAEELRLPLGAITLVMADTDRTPYDMGTVGSRTTPIMALRLHRVAAATRELLIDLAAARLHVERAELDVADGRVRHAASGRSLGYGELTQGQRLTQEYGEDAPITPAEQWAVAGTSPPKVDARLIVTGARQYTPDMARPGMLVGRVLRPPRFGATLSALDTAGVAEIPGARAVRDGELVGVVAPDRQSAGRALAALRAGWSIPTTTEIPDLYAYLRENPIPPGEIQRRMGPPDYEAGSVADGLAAAAHTLAQSYTVAYLAHAPLEPRAALAEWSAGRLTVWTGTQRPFGVRTELAEALGVPESQVRVIVPDTGAAYGGKHTGEAAIEAARMARAAGCPVKLVWTREEEFTWAYVRPAGLIEIVGGVGADGALTAWEHHNYNSGAVGILTPYTVPNQRSVFHPTLAPLRQGSYRALAATANAFARETHMDELAALLGADPLTFRLQNLRNDRLRAVFEAAAERFGWGAAPGPGRGFGIAGGIEKESYVAACAEVEVDTASGHVRVVRIVQAFECGAIVNPDGLHNQVEGAIIQGLGAALFEQVVFADGQIQSDRFSRYRVPRFSDIPAIEIVLLNRRDLPSVGAGETPIIAVAPAVGNAIFAASGVRLRSMPLAPHGLPGLRP